MLAHNHKMPNLLFLQYKIAQVKAHLRSFFAERPKQATDQKCFLTL